MSLKEEIEKSRRGAPQGNSNAVKHGYYSAKFKKSERDALEKTEFSGLSEEIVLQRLIIHRLVTLSGKITDFYEYLEFVRVSSLAFMSLSRLVRAQAMLAMSGDDELKQAFDAALKQIQVEWKLE